MRTKVRKAAASGRPSRQNLEISTRSTKVSYSQKLFVTGVILRVSEKLPPVVSSTMAGM